MLCPQCHQPVTATEYFCPNCGKKLNEPPLSTSAGAQAGLYIFSIILPMICFLAVTRWRGIKYARSDDPKTRQIGLIAIALLAVSTFVTFWLAAIWINQTIQSSVNSVGNLGF